MPFYSTIRSSAFGTALKLIAVVLLIFNLKVSAQTITHAEYFFDTDPGVGNGTPITIPSPSDEVTFTSNISTAGLDPGYHILFVRTKSSDDLWSLYEHREFIIESPIQEAEYFFDEDPGVGNGYPLSVLPGQLSLSPTIPTTGLADGDHLLFLRTRHADLWSLSEPIAFYIQTRIVEAEYFVDTDPGLGNGTPLTVASPSDEINLNANISLTAMTSGVHYLFVRTKDIFGNWSLYEGQAFTVDPALPVELTDLKATVTAEKNVVVTWRTLSENISDYFSVMRSEDGQNFSEFGRAAAAGESKVPRNYSAVDHHPASGNNYYRLKMVDLDGQSTLSNIVVARLDGGASTEVYPNPVVDNWVIDFSQSKNERIRSIELFDVNGRKKLSFTTIDQRTIHMNREGLSSGIYLLKISSSEETKVYKLYFR